MSNNEYVTGTFNQAFLNIYNKDGSVFKTLNNLSSTYSSYLVKYDLDGFGIWATIMGGNGATNVGLSVSTDFNNNVYVTGKFSSPTFTIYNADLITFSTLTNIGSSGDNNVFVVKYNSSGYVQWVNKMGGISSTSNDAGTFITTDLNNNVYITGSFSDATFTIYNADGITFSTLTNTSTSGTNVFVVKYNSSGYVQWATKMGGTTSPYDFGNSITIDLNNNVYITGQFTDTTFTIYNADGITFSTLTNTIISGNNNNVFVVKYNSSGYVQWATKMGGTTSPYDAGTFITTDLNNNVYVTGQFSDATFTIYNADGITFSTLTNTIISGNNNNVFVVKYNSSGYIQWATKMGGTNSQPNDTGSSLLVDKNNNVIVMGNFIYPITIYNSDNSFNTNATLNYAGANNVFLVKYNSSGFVQWITGIGNTNNKWAYGYCISTDENNNIFLTGNFNNGSVNIYNSDGNLFKNLIVIGGYYWGFLINFNSNGFGQWVNLLGANNTNETSIPYGVCCNKTLYIYIGNPLLNSTNPSPLILFYPGTITLNYYGNITDQYQLVNNLGQVVSSTFSFNSTNNTITFNVIIQYGGNNILSFYDTTLNKLIGTFSIETSGICFKEGTKIMCLLDKQEKYIPIEQIQEDMSIKVYTGKHKKPEYKRASAIVKSQLINTPVTTINKLYRLSKSVCPQLIEDLYVTGSHALLHDQLTEEEHEKMSHLADFYNTYTIRLENEEAMSEEQRETLKNVMRSYNDYQITHLDKFKLIAYYNEDFEEVNIEKVFNIYHIVLENVNKYDSYGIYANGILAESTSEASLERFPHYERINSLQKREKKENNDIQQKINKYTRNEKIKKCMDAMLKIEDQTIQKIEHKVNHTSKRRKTIHKNRTYKNRLTPSIHLNPHA